MGILEIQPLPCRLVCLGQPSQRAENLLSALCFHSVLSFLLGALYSRKFTIDGEQISLQVQDTPFVSLEVKWLPKL